MSATRSLEKLAGTCLLAALASSGAAGVALAQPAPSSVFAVEAGRRYRITPNITYLTANNFETKLDVYQLTDVTTPRETLIFFHGGGWVQGTKAASSMQFLPYMEAGWNIVNVEYRLSRVSPAPAAAEDALCALRWTIRNAKLYNIDPNRLIASVTSAGGHLALSIGIIPASAGLDRQCPGMEELKVAAVVNWYGISDVAELLEGPNMKTYAVTWLGSAENRQQIARRVSPITYVRPGLPPVISIQADHDPTVPYAQNERLHAALDKVGVPNQLVTVQGNTHGNYKPSEYIRLYAAIQAFLAKNNLWSQAEP